MASDTFELDTSSDIILTSRLLHSKRGCARFQHGGKPREAVHDLDQSLTFEPAQPLALLQKGKALLEIQVRDIKHVATSEASSWKSCTCLVTHFSYSPV